MSKLLHICNTGKESDVLGLAFKQKGLTVQYTGLSRAAYLKCLQYKPNALLVEFSKNYRVEAPWIQVITKNRKISKITVLAYGPTVPAQDVSWLQKLGIKNYQSRPLKFSALWSELSPLFEKNSTSPPVTKATDLNADDYAFLEDPKKMGGEKLDFMAERVGRLLAFPFTVMKIITIANDESSGAPELAKVISSDSALTTTVLKVSNSVLFASRDRRIRDIKEAIVRIGFNETKNIALGLKVMSLIQGEARIEGFDRMDYWLHSLAVAVIAEKLAKRAGYSNPSEAFICGLLHDFGVLLLDEFFNLLFEKSMKVTTDRSLKILAGEFEVIGINHLELAEAVFTRWNLPKEIIYAVCQQEKFDDEQVLTDPKIAVLATSVGMAKILAKSASIGQSCDSYVRSIHSASLKLVKSPAGFSADFFKEVQQGMDLYRQFFGLDAAPAISAIGSEVKQIAVLNLVSQSFEPQICILQQLGHKIVPILKIESLFENEKKFSLILVNTDKNTPTQLIGQILGKHESKSEQVDMGGEAKTGETVSDTNPSRKMPSDEKSRPDTKGEAPPSLKMRSMGIPCLVLVEESNPFLELDSTPGFFRAPKEGDLRTYEATVIELMGNSSNQL